MDKVSVAFLQHCRGIMQTLHKFIFIVVEKYLKSLESITEKC